jgi:ABC-type sugar transport system permease subunit
MSLSPKRLKKLKDNLEGYLFVAPSTILIGVFGIFPIVFTVFISLHRWRIRMGQFVGLKNYAAMFGSLWFVPVLAGAFLLLFLVSRLGRSGLNRGVQRWKPLVIGTKVLAVFAVLTFVAGVVSRIYQSGDSDMLDSLRTTIWYSLGTVPLQLVLGLLLAVLFDRKFRGKQAFRVVFLLPYIVPTVASAAVFERIFSLRHSSFANQVMYAVGAKPLQWLEEPRGIFDLLFGLGGGHANGMLGTYLNTWLQGPSLALVAVMVFNQWVYVGYYALIFSNGLAQIPKQLYDAAEVDGAHARTVFFRIILPLLSPTTFFLTMIGVIGTFKAFTQIFILRNAAAQGTVDTLSIYIFFTFFRKSLFGYAAAMSLLLFAIVIALTLYQRRIMGKQIHYGE